MGRTRVAVLYGGRSTEHAVSCVSAAGVLAALDPDRYEAVPIGITTAGRWVHGTTDPERLAIRDGVLPGVTDGEPTSTDEVLDAVDVVFPVLHGPYGEDGTIQGLLELRGVPYVGSGVLASAAAMHKAVAKRLLTSHGVPTAAAVTVTARGWARDPGGVRAEVAALGLPVFVKPARGGSSIGISKVDLVEQLDEAVRVALACDPVVLVEAAVVGREVEIGVLDGPDGPRVSVPAEVEVVGDHAFYDFEAKYLDGATRLVCPAPLPDDVHARLRDVALLAFHAMGCEGLARVDVFVTPDGQVVLNELNTMPGFTPTSMFPLMWSRSGVPYPDLVDHLVQDALRRGTGLR